MGTVIIMFREAKALVNDHTYVAKNNFQMLSGSSYFRRLSCAKNGKTDLKRRIKIGRTTIAQALAITNNHDVFFYPSPNRCNVAYFEVATCMM